MGFIHLHTHSPFSFLDGASSLEELIEVAAGFDMPALAISDHDNLCAAVKFQLAAEDAGIKAIQGAEITLEDESHLTLLARDEKGYQSLCLLLTRAHLDNDRGDPRVKFTELEKLQNVIVLSGCRKSGVVSRIIAGDYRGAVERVAQHLRIWGRENFYLELQGGSLPGDSYINHRLLEMAEKLGIEAVAAANVHYAHHENFIIHDLLTCVRTLTMVQEIHPVRPLNGENYLKGPEKIKEIFAFYPRAINNTLKIASECSSPLKNRKPHLPAYCDKKEEAVALLRHLAFAGAKKRYGKITSRVKERLDTELEIIAKLGYSDYFLVVWDIVRFARRQGIRYAGRGSAADSLVVYCLYISEVDSLERGLLFERFMSMERSGLPDIDIDFESRYRDDVIAYVYQRYGEDRVARVATYNTFQARSALRDIGKALGFNEEELGPIAKMLPHIHADNIRKVLSTLPELRQSVLQEERFQFFLDVCEKIAGFPRFLGTHLGGIIIGDIPLLQLTPLQKSALGPVITQFDKDDVEELGLAKLDLLPLRTLAAVSDTVHLINKSSGGKFNYDRIPLDDRESYEMINQGETIGAFQIESPAQRALQAHFNASHMEDMVASMALIRPGPIKGNMVDPYIARRHGQEEVTYLHPRLKPILEKTYGVVLFQEQVIEIAIAIAGFSPGEADRLRRVMTHSRSEKAMQEIGKEFIQRSKENGIEKQLAAKIFEGIRGYAGYGFCEAHAAAFATTSFKTAYFLCHYPAEYYAAILNNYPMGFYPPYIICNEARRRGIEILPPDVNWGGVDFDVENGCIRVGLKRIKGISSAALMKIKTEREKKVFASPLDFLRRTRVSVDVVENLVKCGAMDSLQQNRRQILADLPGVLEYLKSENRGEQVIFENPAFGDIPDFNKLEKAAMEREILGLDLGEHFMARLRRGLKKINIVSSRDIKKLPDGTKVMVAGMLFHPHRPPTRSGKITVFFSLTDEYGLIDITMFEDIYMKYGDFIFGEQKGPLLVKGILNRRGNGVSIIAREIQNIKI